MPYIGRSSNFGVRTRFLYTATASQTSFTGADTQNLTLSYSDSNFIDVHQNGVLLKVVDDYTATTGTSVVLATGATANDVIEITVYDVFSIANHIKKTGDAMAGTLTNIDIEGTELILDVDGDTSITADTDDQIDIKIAGADDFQFTANTFTALSGSTIAAQAITATTIGATGVVTANAGVVVDNITIDGTEIDLSSGSLTIDVAGNIILDSANNGETHFSNAGTQYGQVSDSSGDMVMGIAQQDKDFLVKGNDGGSIITAFTLDLSDAGAATLNNGLTLSDGDLTVASGHGINFAATSDGTGANQAELLSDYEEGTWTPALTNGTSLIVTNARYTKIGQLVYAGAYISSVQIPNNGSVVFIEGLPFTVASNAMYHAGGTVSYVGSFNITGLHLLSPTPDTGTNRIYFHMGSATSSQVLNSDFTGLTNLIFSVIYITDS